LGRFKWCGSTRESGIPTHKYPNSTQPVEKLVIKSCA